LTNKFAMNNIDLRFITSEDFKIVQEIIVAATEGVVSAEKESEFAAKIADWRRRYACEVAGVYGSDPSFIKSLIWHNQDNVDVTWRRYANGLEKEFLERVSREIFEEQINKSVWLESDEREKEANS